MGEKAATNEVISKLMNTLGDQSVYVRASACEALGTMGEKVATNEMISTLVNALEDKSWVVRRSACVGLGKTGEKAATNEVISKLVSALGDETDDVRMNACYALGTMGEKVVTNEVISKLASIGESGGGWNSYTAANTAGNLLSSSAMITQLDPNVISYLCLSKYGSMSLKNVSADQLMNAFFATKNPDWLPVVAQCTFLEGAAVTVTEDKVVVYSRKEPLKLFLASLNLRQQLIEAFTDQAKRLHLSFEMPSEAWNES
jgi:hypothetical protein